MPGNSGELVVTTAGEHLYPFRPTRLRVHWAPGIPHALFLKGGTFLTKPRAKTRGEIAKLCAAVIASEAEAIHSFFARHDGLLRFARNDDVGYLKIESAAHPPLSSPAKA